MSTTCPTLPSTSCSSRMDMDSVISCLEYYGGVAPSICGQHVKLPGGSWGVTSREPLGVVGGVGAWNYPLQTCTWKVAPALACGNTFIYKPSPLAPLAAVVLGEVLSLAGVPTGVYGVVQGEGETGALLTQHQGLDKLSFTGSVPTGSKIMAAGAIGLKNVTLELGGKSPLIVFEDADMKNAVKGALMANFLTQGEVRRHSVFLIPLLPPSSLASPITPCSLPPSWSLPPFIPSPNSRFARTARGSSCSAVFMTSLWQSLSSR